MKLGVDFGTTRVVVAGVDRGNFPVVGFESPDGFTREWFPPLVAVLDGERLYGWQAWAAQERPDAIIVRSLKRVLAESGPQTNIQLGLSAAPLSTLLAEMMQALRKALLESSTLSIAESEPLEIMLGVPANANSNQRFLTVDAFRQAGFQVLGLLNEPSAAAIEFGHSNREKRTAKDKLLVYDLGGGTFDASLVELEERSHAVLSTEGIATLGGDDFDEVLADLALDLAALDTQQRDAMTQAELFRLHEECRNKKEALHPNTRKINVDLECARPGWPVVSIPVAEFYERCSPLIEETLHAVEDLLAGHETLEALYVTGGGSELPMVARSLRDRFGKRVKRSAYARSATAIGLAIQADAASEYVLREKFTRFFGVWRETDSGRVMTFDPLFPKGVELPRPGEQPLEVHRSYWAVHNIGHFRYLECSQMNEWGHPAGDIAVWDEIRFPFDAALRDVEDLSPYSVYHARQQQADEHFSCDSSGTVTVTISNLSAGYSRQYRLGRWASKDTAVVPGKKRRAPARRRTAAS
jgi:molecular chaperone DnaK (HSP70)